MPTTTNTAAKRSRGRPRKTAEQNTSTGLTVSASLSDAVEQALKQVLNGTKPKAPVQKPRDIRADEYGGQLVRTFEKKNGKELLIVGRRQTNYRKKTYDFIDVRTFYFSTEADKWCPTTKGITVTPEALPDFIKALADAARVG